MFKFYVISLNIILAVFFRESVFSRINLKYQYNMKYFKIYVSLPLMKNSAMANQFRLSEQHEVFSNLSLDTLLGKT